MSNEKMYEKKINEYEEVFCALCAERPPGENLHIKYSYDEIPYCLDHARIKFLEVKDQANEQYNVYAQARRLPQNPYKELEDLFDEIECEASQKNSVCHVTHSHEDGFYCSEHMERKAEREAEQEDIFYREYCKERRDEERAERDREDMINGEGRYSIKA